MTLIQPFMFVLVGSPECDLVTSLSIVICSTLIVLYYRTFGSSSMVSLTFSTLSGASTISVLSMFSD